MKAGYRKSRLSPSGSGFLPPSSATRRKRWRLFTQAGKNLPHSIQEGPHDNGEKRDASVWTVA